MKARSESRLPLLGIFAACAIFVLLFTVIQLSPLLQLGQSDLVTFRGHWFPQSTPVDTPQEAEKLPYTPHSGVLPTGNLLNDYWVKIQVKPTGDPALLGIGPASVDRVDVWQRRPDGSWKVDRGGIQLGFNQRDSRTLFFSVPIMQDAARTPSGDIEMLLHMRTNTGYLQTLVYPADKLLEFDAGLRTGFGFYMGISLWVFTVCLVVWLATGDKIWLDALLYDCTFFFYAACQTGMLYKQIPGLSGYLAGAFHVLSIIGVTLAMCRFTIISTALFERPAWLVRPYWFGYYVCLFATLLLVLGMKGYALALTNAYLLLTCLWGFVLLVKLRKGNFVLLTTYRVLLLLYSIVPLLFIGSALFKAAPSDALIHVAAPQNNIFTMVMIMMLLGFRAWNQTREQIDLAREKELLATRLEMEEEKLAEASGFLSMIIHEVKNPLNYIRLAISNLASERNLSDYAQRTLGKIEKSVNSIDSVLERSIEAEDKSIRAMEIRKKTSSMDSLVHNVLAEFSEQDRNRIRPQFQHGLIANIDSDLIGLALRNLLENALKYSPPGTLIMLKLEVTSGKVRLQVANPPGEAGFPDEHLLFQKFYRSKDAMHISGTGLGLYWVRQAMRRMEGDVSYYRLDNSLICFELWTPA